MYLVEFFLRHRTLEPASEEYVRKVHDLQTAIAIATRNADVLFHARPMKGNFIRGARAVDRASAGTTTA